MLCSLINKSPQMIYPNVWTALRFDEESLDSLGWHTVNDLADPASALIMPKSTGEGLLAAMVFWAAAPVATQYLHRFTRDPFDADKIDSTCTNDRVPTPGQQFHTFTWPLILRKNQPVALMVAHNAPGPLVVNLAEFKAWVP